MKSVGEIISDLTPTLEELEPDRLLYRKKSSTYLLVIFLPLIGIAIAAISLKAAMPFMIGGMIWLVLSVILYQIKAGTIASRYKARYKATIIPQLLKTIDPQLSHAPEQGIPSSAFVESELFKTKPDRYQTEDLIHGIYGKTLLQLAEVNAQQRQTSTDSNGRSRTRYVSYFDGLLLIADFHKHFEGRTFIFPDKAEKTFGGFARFFQKAGGRKETRLIQLENPDFEYQFKVYATDEVEARYILSTSMMQRIAAMQSRFGKDVRIAFKDSRLILTVPHSKPFLEPNTKTAATDPAQIEDMLKDLVFFLDTIEELDLNTRIWTKA
ncbi:MAG: DUF3137 domain-containing protein [Verrucomicrobiales bacterium]|nr:DUF3137 domain-containing protein [Verrucomicrobiales bacterium]